MFGLAVVPAKLHQADLNPLWSRALGDTMFFHCKRLSVRQHFGSSQCAADGKCRFKHCISSLFVAAHVKMPGSTSNERACGERNGLVTFSVLTIWRKKEGLGFALDKNLLGNFVTYCKMDERILYGFWLNMVWTICSGWQCSRLRQLSCTRLKHRYYSNNNPPMVYLKRMRGQDPVKRKKSSKSENKMGSDPSTLFCGCNLFFEGPNPSS